MDAKINKSILRRNDLKYLLTVLLLLFFLIIFDIAAIKYKLIFPSFRNRTIYILFVSIWLFIVYAIKVRQDLLIYFMNNLLSSTKGWSIKVSSTNNLKQFDILSWSYYDNKFKKIIKYSFVMVGVYVFIAFILFSIKDLTLKTWTAPVVTFWIYFIWYLKSIYLQNYFKEIVNMNTISLSHSKNINSLKIYAEGFSKKNMEAWILSGAIVLCGIILNLFKFVDIFSVVTVFWFAFLYPAIRLTIDLDVRFYRFSFAFEKAISDLSPAKDESA